MWKLKTSEGSGPWLNSTNRHIGRQHWEFDHQAGTPEQRAEAELVRQDFKKNRFQRKQSSDLLMRMQLRKENSHCPPIPPAIKVKDIEDVTEEAVVTTLRRGISFCSTIQARDGFWPAESAGPLFFMPPLNEDGGSGLHIEGHSSMFGSILSYIALRLLGEGPEDGEDRAMARGRGWILDRGGAVATPSWGKFWLSVLGVYDWAGCNPLPPEFWLLPKFFPIHPAQMMCYCRLVYMPMSYLYGKRFVGSITELIHSLRNELYVQPYHQVDWNNTGNTIAKEDLYFPHPLVQDMLWGFLYHYVEPIMTQWPFSILRKKALEKAMEHVHYEDENSRYICIGVVEKVLCLLACWVEDPLSEAFKCHLARLPDCLWVAEDGMKMQTFGSQAWEAALSIQAILSSNLAEEYGPMLKKAHDLIKASQVRDNPSGNFMKMHRHISKGCWTFSTRARSWLASL